MFSFKSLRSSTQAPLSRRLYKLIKTENEVIDAYETAGRGRQSIALQLSEWGQETGDEGIDEISDKMGVILSEIGATEEEFAQQLEDYRQVLKTIRNTERSVEPSRVNKQKISDQIAQLKYKEPTAPKLAQLEQELVRAEAENLVAEAQLTNVTRQKLKEAYARAFAAHLERAERQVILAKHGRAMLQLLDDQPVVPGDERPAFAHSKEARELLNQVEQDLAQYSLEVEEIETAQLESNLMPMGSNAEANHGQDATETTTDEPSKETVEA